MSEPARASVESDLNHPAAAPTPHGSRAVDLSLDLLAAARASGRTVSDSLRAAAAALGAVDPTRITPEGGARVVRGLERRGGQRVAEPIGERGAHGVTSLDRRQPERAAGRAEVA